MNRRRRQPASPFSLFSFQDIMTSIMGILVLVTLIMALDLTQAAMTSESSTMFETDATTPQDMKDETEVRHLARQQAALQTEYNRLASSLMRQAGVLGNESTLVNEAQKSLAQMYERIEDLNEQVRQRKARIESNVDQERRERLLERVVSLEQELAQLAASIEDQQRNPTLTYILQAGSDKRPLLIELSESEITVGAADASQSPVRLRTHDRALRLLQLKQLLRTHDQRKEYIVILLKPSAFGRVYHEFCDMIKESGFSIGLELIPESQSVFGLTEGD